MIVWDGGGVWLMAKRLGKVRFSWPQGSDGTKITLEPAGLTMLLSGIDLKGAAKKRGTSVLRRCFARGRASERLSAAEK